MPVVPEVMAVDAKVEHWCSSSIDLDAAASVQRPSLKEINNRIALFHAAYEVNIANASTGPAIVQIGNASSASIYGTVSVGTAAVAGTYINWTQTAAQKAACADIPANTEIQINHVDTGTAVGDGFLHLWFYRKRNTLAVQV